MTIATANQSEITAVAATAHCADTAFFKACDYWDKGKNALAFQTMLKAARQGLVDAQVDVGYFYDCGIGTRRNKTKALEWYRKAAKRGNGAAANNIATVYQEKNRFRNAIFWYSRAIELGNEHAHLGIAKLYLSIRQHKHKARTHLAKVMRSDKVCEDALEQARELLEKLLLDHDLLHK